MLDYRGSYYDQTSLSSVLLAFEACLTLLRSKAAGVSANESAPDTAALTTSAPVLAALTMSAATEASTEAATEVSTEVATEAATEVSTKIVTEASTEASTEVDTEASTEASTEVATEASTEASTEVATEASTEASTEVATEASTEAAMSAPALKKDYIKEESQTSKEGLLPVHEISEPEHRPQCRSPLALCNQHGFLPHSGECAQLVFQGGCYGGSRRSDFVVGCAHRNDVLLSRGHSAPLERDLRAKAHQSVVSWRPVLARSRDHLHFQRVRGHFKLKQYFGTT